ncbi:MAG: LptA/OstA family protein [Steroidobacteraceae bacterium]
MAASRLSLGLALLCLASSVVAQPAVRSSLPITVEAAGSDFDYKNGRVVLRQVTIVQGDTRVRAQQATATGLEFENSSWLFEGDVSIEAPEGSLASQSASVRFLDNTIQRAEVEGTPASFERVDETRTVSGRAARIDYDLVAGTVRLTGEAWISDGENEIVGSALVYSITEQRVLAEAAEQGGQPVRITIQPRSLEDPQP